MSSTASRTRRARSAMISPAARSGRPRSSSIRPTAACRHSPPKRSKRRAPRDRGTFGDGPFDTTEDFTLYDRCITRGIVGSVLRVVYGNGNRIVQAPGMVAISYEMIHDTRVMYTDGRPHISPSIRQLPRRLAGPLGRRRARGRDDEPDGPDEHRRQRQRPAPQREHGHHRALQARRRRRPPVPVHG